MSVSDPVVAGPSASTSVSTQDFGDDLFDVLDDGG